MARKRTHEAAPRTKLVSVRLREATYDRVTAAAAAASLSRAGYLEHLIEDRAVVVEQTANDALPVALINELKRLGNNLNQIAHNAHCQIPPQEGQLAKVVSEIIQTLAESEIMRRRLAAVTGTAPDATPEQHMMAVRDRIVEPFLPAPVFPVPPSRPTQEPKATEPAAMRQDLRAALERLAGNRPLNFAIPVPAAEAPKVPEPAAPHLQEDQPPPVAPANSKTVFTVPKGWVLTPEVREPEQPVMTSRPWTAPTGFDYSIAAVDGEIVATPLDSLFVRIARTIWYKFSPPPEPDFDATWRCNKHGQLQCIRRPRQRGR
jgi:hypothetical protein